MDVGEDEIYAFIYEHFDSVPHLEALLQIWNSRPKAWTDAELAARLYLNPAAARSIMADLARHGLLTVGPNAAEGYCYASALATDRLVEAVAGAYRADLIRISNAIHSKASAGVREFARAFRFMRKGKKS